MFTSKKNSSTSGLPSAICQAREHLVWTCKFFSTGTVCALDSVQQSTEQIGGV